MDASPGKPPPPKKRFILVADDDPILRNMIADFLDIEGYRVATSASGWEAVLQAESLSVELLITDVMMPGQDGTGLDAYRKIRSSQYARRDLPIIFVTALTPAQIQPQLPKDPKVRLLFKPVKLEELHAVVKELVGH